MTGNKQERRFITIAKRLSPRLVVVFILVALSLVWSVAPSAAQGNGGERRQGQSIRNDESPALRDITPLPDPSGKEPREKPGGRDDDTPRGPRKGEGDPVAQTGYDRLGKIAVAMPTPSINYEGTTNTESSYPPDPMGEVGPNHYVQIVNFHFQIFNKAGATLYGPAPTKSLWSGFGAPCETRNDGDGIVLYDSIANRWLISQMTSAVDSNNLYGQCIAISTTPDPTGSYYRYYVPMGAVVPPATTGEFYDYPKYGVWPDGYYFTANRYTSPTGSRTGASAIVLNRTAMLAGQPLTYQEFPVTGWPTMLPADLDGATQPAPGTPGYFGSVTSTDFLIWTLAVNWANPAQSVFTGPTALPVAPYNTLCPSTRNCIPQPGTTVALDDKDDRLMFRLAYRQFYSHASLVVSHNVNLQVSPTIQAGIRWYEIRVVNGTPSLYQQGTFSPDAVNRWMGSLAMDKAGNIGLGYSVSDATSVYPGIRYTGRLSTDTLNLMTFTEGTLVNGAGSQTGTSSRWGDYTNMSVDPNDDCTFWFSTEYMPATGPVAWSTRVGAFTFPSCVTAGVPSAPQTPAASTQPGGIQVTWTAPASNGGTPLTGYKIYRGLDQVNQTLLTTVGVVTSYLDTAVQNGNTYYYEIKAINYIGEGSPSADVGATYTGPNPPSAPQNLNATGGTSQVSLTWTTPASDGGAAITGYKVYRGTVSNNLSLLTTLGVQTAYTDLAVVNGTLYYYEVTALNSAGESARSNQSSATPQAPQTPSAPQNLVATPGNTTMSLTWQAPANSGSAPVTNYKIYRGTTSGSQTLLTTVGNVLAYNDTGLVNGTTYYYKVSAVSSAGEGAFSNIASGTPTAPTVPGAPQNFTATPGDKQVTLAWDAPASNGGSPITNYLVYRGTKSTSLSLIATLGDVRSYVNTGLTAGTTYYFKVAAKNAIGTGASTAVLSAVPYAVTVPGVPTNPKVTACNASVQFTWGAPTSDGNSPITGYNIYRGTTTTTTLLTTVSAATFSYLDTAVVNNTTYYYQVAAVNIKGAGTKTTALSAKPNPPTVPGAPTGLVATGGDATVSLTWVAPTSTGGCIPITGYKVYRGLTSTAMSVIATLGNVTAYVDNTVVNNTLYYYKVTALNQVGESAASSTVSVTPKPPTVPSVPQTFKATGLAPGIKLTWVAPASNGGSPITNYKVYRGTTSTSIPFLTQVGNVLLYQDASAAPVGTRFYYQLTAVNAVGESVKTAAVNTTAKKMATAEGEGEDDERSGATVEEVVATLEVVVGEDGTVTTTVLEDNR